MPPLAREVATTHSGRSLRRNKHRTARLRYTQSAIEFQSVARRPSMIHRGEHRIEPCWEGQLREIRYCSAGSSRKIVEEEWSCSQHTLAYCNSGPVTTRFKSGPSGIVRRRIYWDQGLCGATRKAEPTEDSRFVHPKSDRGEARSRGEYRPYGNVLRFSWD